MVDNKFLPKLLQDLLEILDDDEYYDITIEVGDDPDVKIFKAHMVILNLIYEKFCQLIRKMMEFWSILNYQIFYQKFFT
ncbi:hypothetical protein RirG_062700 [Rhizophagus irregularis DAOM 197198w]|uniref:BTB domain-containing protein n=1 Tax=Rhizophagus irregularis (strain DAOM 197198w) TaxID=1432141 RepID=A0A015LKJ0_RHIIW|nr:hypothetical protein RirG_062700 [Rhizophagus irregularis DAOM 197198w]